jgi:hypothetical protein
MSIAYEDRTLQASLADRALAAADARAAEQERQKAVEAEQKARDEEERRDRASRILIDRLRSDLGGWLPGSLRYVEHEEYAWETPDGAVIGLRGGLPVWWRRCACGRIPRDYMPLAELADYGDAIRAAREGWSCEECNRPEVVNPLPVPTPEPWRVDSCSDYEELQDALNQAEAAGYAPWLVIFHPSAGDFRPAYFTVIARLREGE